DVYVFFPQAAPDIVQQVQRTSGEGGPVRFVASVTGSFDAIAVVEVEPDREKESPLAALPSTIAKYFGGNVKGDPPKAVPLINGPLWLRHTRQYPPLAFVGIRVQHGPGRSELANGVEPLQHRQGVPELLVCLFLLPRANQRIGKLGFGDRGFPRRLQGAKSGGRPTQHRRGLVVVAAGQRGSAFQA